MGCFLGGLKRGNTIRISEELGFSWASSPSKDWNLYKIYHNAGLCSNMGGTVFYKADYINKTPWDADFSNISPKSNSYNYVKAIEYAKNNKASK